MKKTIAVFLTTALLLCAAPLAGFTAIDWPAIDFGSIFSIPAHAAIIDSGNCGAQGDNVQWTLDESGLLTVYGTGDMADNYRFRHIELKERKRENSNETYTVPITSIVIEEGVTSVGENAFSFTNVHSVSIADSVSEIKSEAFSHCQNLEDVTFPHGEFKIGQNAFNSSGLKSVVIPSGCTWIYPYAFGYCSDLTNVTLSEGLLYLTGGVFWDCTALESISLPESLLGQTPDDTRNTLYATFQGCSSLKSVNIPSKIRYVDCPFGDCSSLTSIFIPKNVDLIGSEAFLGCSSLSSITVSDQNETYYAKNNCLIRKSDKTLIACGVNSEIPSDGSVTKLNQEVFRFCNHLTSVSIPHCITSIGDEAFWGCQQLTSVTLPDNLTTINKKVFYDCEALSRIYIPKSVTSIKEGAFHNCIRLTDVYYGGTEQEWNRINIQKDNDALNNAKIHYNTSAIFDVSIMPSADNYIISNDTLLDANGNIVTSIDVYVTIENICSSLLADGKIGDDWKIIINCLNKTRNGTLGAKVGDPEPVALGQSRTFHLYSIPAEEIVSAAKKEDMEIALTVQAFSYNEQSEGILFFSKETSAAFHYIPIVIDSGVCGDNAQWTFDGSTLRILGTGEVYPTSYYVNDEGDIVYPWSSFRSEISSVVIEEGITSVQLDFHVDGGLFLDNIQIAQSVNMDFDCLNGCKTWDVYCDSPAYDYCINNLNDHSFKFRVTDALFETSYCWENDRINFSNENQMSRTIPSSTFEDIYGNPFASALPHRALGDGSEGQCYGMACVTAMLMNDKDLLNRFNADSIYEITPDSKYDGTEATFSDMIQYAYAYQDTWDSLSDRWEHSGCENMMYSLESYINGTGEPIIIRFGRNAFIGSGTHELLPVGIAENTEQYTDVLINDCNTPDQYQILRIYKKDSGKYTNNWQYFGKGNYSSDHHNIKTETKAVTHFLSEFDTIVKHTDDNTSNNKDLVLLDCGRHDIKDIIKSNTSSYLKIDEMARTNNTNTISTATQNMYWVKDTEDFILSTDEEDSEIAFYSYDSGIKAILPAEAAANIHIQSNNTDTISISTQKGNPIQMTFVSVSSEKQLVHIMVEGTAASDTIKASSYQGIIQVSGINNIEITLQTEDIEESIFDNVSDGRTITISYDEGTERINTDFVEYEDACIYCGKIHGNDFIGKITKFFHKIIYFFAHMFGKM